MALAAAVVLQLLPIAGPGHSQLQAHASGAGPVVSGISPNSGAATASGNFSVTIYGTGFTSATAVRFGTVGCVSFYATDDSHITAFPPRDTAGTTVDVYVVGPGGTSAASAADRFTYVAATAPVVNGVTPNSGPAAGQTGITLLGSGFSSATRVLFGSSVVTVYAIYVADDNHMYLTAPPGTAGSVDITVVNSVGTSSTSLADHYTYLAASVPFVRAVLPNRGPPGGGTGVQILGHGFGGATAVHFGTRTATIQYAGADDSVFVNSPPGTAGTTLDVTVTTPAGTSPTVNADHFSFIAPVMPSINAISPSRGPAAGGTVVNLFGVGFSGATGVQFGTVAASFTVYDDGTMSVVAPASTAGSVLDVRVTTSLGTSSAVVQDRYTYVSQGTPEVDAVTPNRGQATGGTSVLIIGSGLFNPTAIRFGSAAATTYSASTDGTTVTATSPPGTSGTSVDVVVTTSAGSSAAGASDRFSYVAATTSAPIINALDPNHGSQYGGTAVIIHGSGFTTTGMTVMFGTTSTANFNVTGAGTIAVYSAPAGTVGTTVDVRVSTASGTSTATPADRYTFDAVAAPVVTAVSPNTAASGAAVYITGVGVGSATSVTFGSTPVGVTTFVGADNVIQVTSPPGTAGSTVDVRVTNPAGTSATTTADQFTYSNTPLPVPTVTGVGPGSGTAAGRTTVYVSGSGFLSVSSVQFGTAPASSFYAINDNVLQATSPAHAVGLVDVTVSNSSGTSAISSGDGFTFTTAPVPLVTNVSPSSGPSNGGATVYVSGTGFSGVTTVSFGNATLSSGTGFTVTSDELITVYHSPPQGTNPSPVDIMVTAPGGTSPTSTADHFTFGAPVVPTVTAVSPNSGPATGGTTVYITGTGFAAATGTASVSFGTASGSFTQVISDMLITTVSPAQGTNPSTVHVTVTAEGSTSATSTADQFTWASTPPPTGPVVNGVSPNQGITVGGTNVTVYGSGLSGATAVSFGSAPAVIQYGSDTQIVVHSPAGAAGPVDITVTTGAGTSSTGTADHFTYVAPTAPVINAVDPNHGTAAGGGSATVYGHGFSGATAVHFGSIVAYNFYVGGDTYLYVNQIPAGSAGTVDITITGPGGTSGASAADHYTYMAAGTPAVYAVSPNRGSTLGGTSVTIYGVGLAGATSVTFGTSAAAFYPGPQSDILFYAQSPPVAAGTVDVTVSTGAGTSLHQAADLFTYLTPGPPVIHAVAPNRGSSAGGTSVRLIGSRLSNATSVSFGSVRASFFSNNGDSEVDATSPTASVGTVQITVTTPFGTSAVSAADQFSFFSPPVPAVTGVSPNSGSATGGTLVFISGSGFAGATNLLFGSDCNVFGFTPISDNLIEASTPVGTAGSTVDIHVVTPGGTSATGVADLFTYTAASPPVVTAVGPASGPSVGQTTVYITGTDISGATGVSFGATPALYFYAYYSTYGASDTLLIAGSPPGTVGATVDVTVTTAAGVSSSGAADQFTYTATAAPAVTAVSPSSGPFAGSNAFAGGNSVYITGSGFQGASAVHFGTQLARPAQGANTMGRRKNSPTAALLASPEVLARFPIAQKVNGPGKKTPTRYALVSIPLPRSAKSSALTARAAGGHAAVQGGGRPPSIGPSRTAPLVVPTLPALGGGGGCGGGGPGGPVFCPGFFALDDNVIQVIRTPAGTNGSTVDVTVTTPAGTSATSTADHYSYGATPAPAVSAISPTTGPSGGGTDVLISGSDFSAATGVKFGTVTAVATLFGDNVIDATSPGGTNGTSVDVTVTSPGGTSAVSSNDQFTYGATPTPVVSIVRPASGPGGTSVSVTGTGFTGATAVQFGTTSINPTNWSVQSDTLIQVMAPAGASGSVVDVTVTATGGSSAHSTADQFTFSATPSPAVTIVSPNAGPTTGGTTVYVTGTGFSGASAVNIGATAGTGLVDISDTLIQVTSPAGSGTVDVRVVGLGGTSAATAGDLFTYGTATAPTIIGVSPNTGPVAGGTVVLIAGTNLAGATSVHFGTIAATVTSSGAGQIMATSPPSTGPATVDITVTTAGGTSAVSAADQFTYLPALSVLPAMSNGAYGGYLTVAYLKNTGTSAAHAFIAYFDVAGSPVGTGDRVTIPVNANATVRQDNGHGLPASGAGSAIVYSDQPLAAFVNEFAPGGSTDATSYTAIKVPDGVGPTLYVPAIANNAYGGYTTGIGLLNMGASSTDISITYRDAAGNAVKTQSLTGVPGRAYRALYSGDPVLGLSAGFAGTATIQSTGGSLLAAVVNEVGPNGQFSSYAAANGGSTSLKAPVMLNGGYGGYFTGTGVQNTSGTPGTVTVKFYDGSGNHITPDVTAAIAANAYLPLYQGAVGQGPPASATGYTGVLSSDVPIAAIVNEVAPPAARPTQSTSYNTLAAGAATINLALVENAGSDGWTTGLGVMNTGSTTTHVTVSYYDASTGTALSAVQQTDLAPNAFYGPYQGAPSLLPPGTRATAVLTTSAGGSIAVICNQQGAGEFMSYDGQ